MKKLLGIDIGGTKCAVCIGDADGAVLARRQFDTAESPEKILAEFEKHARELIEKHGAVLATGISCGGPLDSKKGLVLSPPNLPGWDAVPVPAFYRIEWNYSGTVFYNHYLAGPRPFDPVQCRQGYEQEGLLNGECRTRNFEGKNTCSTK
jgi:hypothetical protein